MNADERRSTRTRLCLRLARLGACLLVGLALNRAQAAIDNLRFLGHNEVNRNHLMDVRIVGNRAFIAVGVTNGLEVYDVSNPVNPVRTFAGGPAAWRCCTAGDSLLFLFCRLNGVVICDIQGAGDPVKLGQYDPPGAREALEGGDLIGETLYCAAHQNGIYAIDISNPASPQRVGILALDSSAAWNTKARDSFLFVANGRFGLAVVGTKGGMHVVSRLALPGLANDIALDGNIAALALGASGVATVDITNPDNPVLRDTFWSGSCAFGAGLTNHKLIAGAWTALEMFDIANPDAIARTGRENTKTWAEGADVRSDSLVVVADWTGMSCYRIGPEAAPDIDLAPAKLDFGQVSAPLDAHVLVRNQGSPVLNVAAVRAPAGIAVNPNVFSVAPGDSQIVTVTAAGTNPVSGRIVYVANDPNDTAPSQEVYKNNTAFPQYGSVAPDFTLRGTDNHYHTLAQNQGKVVLLQFGGGW